jgi:hypothetical protein
MFTSLDSVVAGGPKVLNFGGIKMPTSTAFDCAMLFIETRT